MDYCCADEGLAGKGGALICPVFRMWMPTAGGPHMIFRNQPKSKVAQVCTLDSMWKLEDAMVHTWDDISPSTPAVLTLLVLLPRVCVHLEKVQIFRDCPACCRCFPGATTSVTGRRGHDFKLSNPFSVFQHHVVPGMRHRVFGAGNPFEGAYLGHLSNAGRHFTKW